MYSLMSTLLFIEEIQKSLATDAHRTTQIKTNKSDEIQLKNSVVCIFPFCIYLCDSVCICGKNSSFFLLRYLRALLFKYESQEQEQEQEQESCAVVRAKHLPIPTFLGLKPQAVFLHRFAVKRSPRRISTSSASPRFTVRAASLSPIPALMGMFHEPVTSLIRFNWDESEKRPCQPRSNQDANVDIENRVPLSSA